MVYAFLRLGIVPIAFVSWVFYQLIIKKKKFEGIKNDLLVIVVFLIVWFVLIGLVFS